MRDRTELSVTPLDVCSLCHIELGESTENDPNMLILLESGQIKPGRKDPGRYLLYADWRRSRPPLYPAKEIYHAECFFHAMGHEWSHDAADYECACCKEEPHDFRRERYGFRIRIGEIDLIDLVFSPKQDESNEAHICCPCISKVYTTERREKRHLRAVG